MTGSYGDGKSNGRSANASKRYNNYRTARKEFKALIEGLQHVIFSYMNGTQPSHSCVRKYQI